jgi:hypothetical protein
VRHNNENLLLLNTCAECSCVAFHSLLIFCVCRIDRETWALYQFPPSHLNKFFSIFIFTFIFRECFAFVAIEQGEKELSIHRCVLSYKNKPFVWDECTRDVLYLSRISRISRISTRSQKSSRKWILSYQILMSSLITNHEARYCQFNRSDI